MSNRFAHYELSTDDVAGALKFYKKIFDWKFKDMPMGGGMNYTMIDTGEKNVGGGLTAKMMPDQPTAWLAYVQVDSVKKTVAKAEKLGARVFVPYQPIPNMGAFGVFADPTGAHIGVWEMGKPVKKAGKKKAKKK